MRTPLLLACPAFLAVAGAARAQVTVAVDPTADVHPISPLIYGVNFPSDDQIDAAKLTVGRWGGNATTRYNYQDDVQNTAFDYYFENLPGCWGSAQNYCIPAPTNPQENSGANAFLSDATNKGIVALFTIPTIGYTPNAPALYAQPFDCGCPKSANANQDSYDPYNDNCGNGQVNHAFIDCGPASQTSMVVDAGWSSQWVTYLVGKFGADTGGRIYALDNEPNLWSSTHHDVHPTKLTYDELWQKMRDNATAIVGADPTAEISGPAEWGWPNYFCSDADNIALGCSATSPDRAAHGGEELVAWLLDQAAAYEQDAGTRILHYLDLHYYPQGGSPPENTRSLWDPTYTDPSWINDQIQLIPRMHDWVNQHYPGTKIAISEFDFGDHTTATGAVTYAEVLGIFAREGVDMATAWSPPSIGDPAFGAYVLYRNFDGAGGAFESTYARTTVTGAGVAAFGAVGPTRATVALANENSSATDVVITLGNFQADATASVYALGSGSSIDKQPDVTLDDAGAIALSLPATSIAMVVVQGTNPNVPDGGTASTGGTTGSTSTGSTTTSGGTSGGATTSGGRTSGGTTGSSTGTGTTSTTTSGTSGGATTGGGTTGAATTTTGTTTGGTTEVKSSGCGCTTGNTSDALPVTLALALVLMVWRRRGARTRNLLRYNGNDESGNEALDCCADRSRRLH
jgi:MYXO-CTERM domain-containing protein